MAHWNCTNNKDNPLSGTSTNVLQVGQRMARPRIGLPGAPLRGFRTEKHFSPARTTKRTIGPRSRIRIALGRLRRLRGIVGTVYILLQGDPGD